MESDLDCSVTQPLAEDFVERAFQLVAFLAERHGLGESVSLRREDELHAWISSRQQEEPCAERYVEVELSIILRALLGPRERHRDSGSECRNLCKVVAKHMEMTNEV